MNIVEAVRAAFEGKRIRRKEWFFIDNERCVYIYGYRGIDDKITYLLDPSWYEIEQNFAIL